MSATAASQLYLHLASWPSLAQAAGLAVLTFMQEDAPTVTAALLSATGRLSTATGFLGCLLGIWMGDTLLYWFARLAGRPLLEGRWAKRFVSPSAIVRSEQWFAKRGSWLLATSRLVPGTRLPTYLAAGFLRIPFGQFLLVTGIAVGAWTTAIFVFAHLFQTQLADVIGHWREGAWALLATVLLGMAVIRVSLRVADGQSRRRFAAAVSRWLQWEFWPGWLFYAPVLVNYLWLAFRHRGITLPTAANPGIFSGGVVGESKIATLADLSAGSAQFVAEAHLLSGTSEERNQQLRHLIAGGRLAFPLILKPDVGQRGVGVKVIRSPDQAAAYLGCTDAPVICQRYAPGPHEVGVFYYRFPHEPRGRIFAITEKIFPHISGDGVRTIEELIWADRRARIIARKYLARLGERRSQILPAGESLRLVEAGNHAQGCIFRDGMHLWSEPLEQRIDEISRKLNGFFIGRYDIRYAAAAELRAGAYFQIIELNGAASEATSIYDARNSLWRAYRTLFRQWNLVFAIGAANRKRGSRPLPVFSLWRAWRETASLAATYPASD